MTTYDVSTGTHAPYRWKTYRVQRSRKERQLQWVLEALRHAGCKIHFCSQPDVMPVFVVIETGGGHTHGLVVYLFTANSRETKNRPADEHRFQIKYGSDLTGVLDFFVDETGVLMTLILGIDEELDIAVSVDPRSNNPAPMSRSVEFKRRHAASILATGWHVWSRDRNPPKAKDRALRDSADARTETVFGATKESLLQLVMAERLSAGLDAGERHLLGERLFAGGAQQGNTLLRELGVPANTLFDIIENASRL